MISRFETDGGNENWKGKLKYSEITSCSENPSSSGTAPVVLITVSQSVVHRWPRSHGRSPPLCSYFICKKSQYIPHPQSALHNSEMFKGLSLKYLFNKASSLGAGGGGGQRMGFTAGFVMNVDMLAAL
jgi:hypothetical protein